MESKNYKFNLEPKKLSKQDIEKHMDFDALLAKFEEAQLEKKADKKLVPLVSGQSKSKGKFRIVPFASAIAAVLAGVVFCFSLLYDGRTDQQKYFDSQDNFVSENNLPKGINPPHKNIKPQFVSQKLNADKGGKVNIKNSTLIVPEEAFVDKDGELIKGDVEIKYIEHVDFIDIYVSGIPMTYDSASHRYLLESAGMIELYAEQNGQRINVSPGKSIEIAFETELEIKTNEKPYFNIYQLDEDSKWAYKGANNLEIKQQINVDKNKKVSNLKKKFQARFKDLKHTRDRNIAEIEATIPVPQKPVRSAAPNTMSSIDIDFIGFDEILSDLEETEEVKAMRKHADMIWKFAPNQNISDEDADREWDDYKLNHINSNEFELTLISSVKRLKLKLISVESDGISDVSHDDELKVYEKAMTERTAKLKGSKDAILEEYNKRKTELEDNLDQQIQALNNKANAKYARYKIVNRFKVDQLGIWNCDRPVKQNISKLKARFVDSNNVKYDLNTAFIVSKNKNTIKHHYTKEGSQLPIDAKDDNLMWLVTDDNKIAVFRPEEFKAINTKKGDHTFVMKVIDKDIQSKEDIREVLQQL